MADIHDRWKTVTNDGEEFLDFYKVINKRSTRPDVHAFLLLDELFPDKCDLVSGTSHDEIFLSIEDDQIESLTDEQILELSRCGVRLHYQGGLCMFV